MRKIYFFTLYSLVILFGSCKKDPVKIPDNTTDTETIQSEILNSFSVNVAEATYSTLSDKANLLYQAIQTFSATPTDINLTACKQLWKDTRKTWELSEGFLFGPAETQSIDPRIDTWPVNYVDLDSVLADTNTFTVSYINSLDDALRGFHPIEYLLFGTNGNKTTSQFTEREKQYLLALANHLKSLTTLLAQGWSSTIPENYAVEFTTAGQTTSLYPNKRAAFEELVNAMIGICDEVANGKIEEPFAAQNPLLEESPFSANSITDFTNNIKSVQNVYLGNYIADGKGLEDLVRLNNLSLDGTIKNKINTAIASLNTITLPFGEAIVSQQVQITNAQAAINSLKETLENDLFPFIQAHTN